MPFIRGKFIPEIESVGRAKRALDVLVWMKKPLNIEIAKTLDDLEHLRIYLGHIVPPAASIRVMVPNSHAATLAVMDANQIERLVIPESENLASIPALVREKLPDGVAILAATALSNDVDCIVTDVAEWLPY